MSPAELRSLILAQPDGSPIRLAFASGNDWECARLLRETTAPQLALPPLNSAAQLMGMLSAQSFAAAFDHPRFGDFRETFNSGNRTGVVEWVVAFHARGLMTQAERDAIVAYLTTPTEQDLPLASVDHLDIAAARKAGE